MTDLNFSKMHGCSNDYVVVAAADVPAADAGSLARALADRRRGVGCDGLLRVAPAASDAEFGMRMFNPDGSEAEMCGNGLRCAVRFAVDRLGAPPRGHAATGAGRLAYDATHDDGAIRIELGVPSDTFAAPIALSLDGTTYDLHAGRLGNPHAVLFVEDVDAFDLAGVGPLVEHDAHFPERTNFEVVHVVADDHLRQRTWERGAGETMACGTGAGAVCVAAAASGRAGRDVRIDLRGGTLRAAWQPDGRVFLTGPAVYVFEGTWPRAPDGEPA